MKKIFILSVALALLAATSLPYQTEAKQDWETLFD